jgi:hypothetical protein
MPKSAFSFLHLYQSKWRNFESRIGPVSDLALDWFCIGRYLYTFNKTLIGFPSPLESRKARVFSRLAA